MRRILPGTPLDTSSGVNSVPLKQSDFSPPPVDARSWSRRFRRVRVALALLILIGITTPHATSAPAAEAEAEADVEAKAVFATAPALDGPPMIVLFGAAMLVIAGALRRSENPRIRG